MYLARETRGRPGLLFSTTHAFDCHLPGRLHVEGVDLLSETVAEELFEEVPVSTVDGLAHVCFVINGASHLCNLDDLLGLMHTPGYSLGCLEVNLRDRDLNVHPSAAWSLHLQVELRLEQGIGRAGSNPVYAQRRAGWRHLLR